MIELLGPCPAAGEGQPLRLLSYIGGVGNYRKICDDVQNNGYEEFKVA